MDFQLLEEQLTGLEFPKCDKGQNHYFSHLCQKPKCPYYFEPMCDTCKNLKHDHNTEDDFAKIRQLLLGLIEQLKQQDKLQHKPQEEDRLILQAKEFGDLGRLCLQIEKNLKEFQKLVLQKNQNILQILEQVLQFGSSDFSQLKKSLAPIQQYLKLNDIDWETNKLEFKFDAESMEEEILNISLRLKEPLSSLKQLVEETDKFCADQRIFQEGEQFVEEKKKQALHCTNFWVSNYQQSQQLIYTPSNNPDEPVYIYQGSNKSCQYICSKEQFYQGNRQVNIQIMSLGDFWGKLHLGIMDEDSFKKGRPYDPNPNIDIFSGNNCGMKFSRGKLKIDQILDSFEQRQNYFDNQKDKCKNKRILEKIQQEEKERKNQLIFTATLSLEDFSFKIREEFHELEYELEPKVFEQLKAKKWRLFILWRNSTAKIKILDNKQMKAHNKNFTHTAGDQVFEESLGHKKFRSEQVKPEKRELAYDSNSSGEGSDN